MELEEDKGEVQMMPVTGTKQHYLEAEIGARVKIEAKGLASGRAGEGGDNNNNNDDNNNNNNREETPLAERVAVAKAIARSLSEGETEAGPEAGLGDDR